MPRYRPRFDPAIEDYLSGLGISGHQSKKKIAKEKKALICSFCHKEFKSVTGYRLHNTRRVCKERDYATHPLAAVVRKKLKITSKANKSAENQMSAQKDDKIVQKRKKSEAIPYFGRCEKCNECFHRQERHNMHDRFKHPPKKPLICQKCPAKFAKFAEFWNHMKRQAHYNGKDQEK